MRPVVGAKVYRSGETVRRYNFETGAVSMDSANDKLRVFFKIASKGGGVTDIKLELTPIVFDRMCREMSKVAPKYTASTMARHLSSLLNPEPD